KVAETDEGGVFAGRLVWGESRAENIGDVVDAAADRPSESVEDAASWLRDFLEGHGHRADSAKAKASGKAAGHNEATLHRARKHLRLKVEHEGFPRRTFWTLPLSTGETPTTATTETTGE